MKSHPFAATLRSGERFILAIGGGAWELMPDANIPRLTVVTGSGSEGALLLPVVDGNLTFVAR